MIAAILILLGFQLGGEVLARALTLPVPGPVIGATALAVALLLRGRIAGPLQSLSHGLLANLSLLFVPAAVGVVELSDVIAEHGLRLVATLIVSTLAAMLVGALAFRLVAR